MAVRCHNVGYNMTSAKHIAMLCLNEVNLGDFIKAGMQDIS